MRVGGGVVGSFFVSRVEVFVGEFLLVGVWLGVVVGGGMGLG